MEKKKKTSISSELSRFQNYEYITVDLNTSPGMGPNTGLIKIMLLVVINFLKGLRTLKPRRTIQQLDLKGKIIIQLEKKKCQSFTHPNL